MGPNVSLGEKKDKHFKDRVKTVASGTPTNSFSSATE